MQPLKSRRDEETLRDEARRLEMQLQAIRKKLLRQLEAEFAREPVTGPQRLVMQALVATEGLSLKDLSAQVGLAHSTVSGIVDRLEGRGMLRRHPLDTDRRVTVISVSPPVRQFLETRMPELTLHPLVAALRRASPAQRQAIQAGLDTLEKLLDR